MTLQEYNSELLGRLTRAISSPWRGKDTVAISSMDACGVTQFLHAHAANLADVDRLDRLDRAGAEWRVIFAGRVLGSGRIRSAIDEALKHAGI